MIDSFSEGSKSKDSDNAGDESMNIVDLDRENIWLTGCETASYFPYKILFSDIR
jgi:hypothetical protein